MNLINFILDNNEKSRTQNSLLNFATGIGGRLLSMLLQFLTRTVFIATLSVTYLGINGVFSNVLTLLSLTELGFGTAIGFKLYKPLAENDVPRTRLLMKFYKQAYIIVGVVIFIIGLLMIPTLPFLIKGYEELTLLKIDAVAVFLLYLLQSVSTYWFFAYRTAIVEAAQRKYVLDIIDYAISILTCIVQITILLVWHNFMLYIASVIFFNLFRNGTNAYFATKMFPNIFVRDENSISWTEVKEIVKDCMAIFVYKVNGVVLTASDNLVLSKFIGLTIVGLYSNYLIIFSSLKGLLKQIYMAVKPSMGNLYATDSIEKKYLMFEVMNLLTVAFYGIGMILISVTSNEFVRLWIGDEYTIPQPFPFLIGLELFVDGMKANLGQIRDVSGAFRQMWFRPILAVIINLIVSISLVKYCGIYGVIIGTIVADLSTNIAIDPIIIHRFSFSGEKQAVKYYRKNFLYMLVATGVCFADIYICIFIKTGFIFIDILFHFLICIISLPLLLYVLFGKTEEGKYIVLIVRQQINSRIISKL